MRLIFVDFLNRTFFSSLALVAVMTSMLVPLLALADDEVINPDARLEGYANSPAIREGGTGGTVVLLLLLITLTMGVMFINAKRSHLD